MYKYASTASFILRVLFCYYTVETTPVFANPATEWLLGQIVSIFVVLKVFSYGVVGAIGYEHGQAPTAGAFLYFVVYVALTFILWVLLLIMTGLEILPIGRINV